MTRCCPRRVKLFALQGSLFDHLVGGCEERFRHIDARAREFSRSRKESHCASRTTTPARALNRQEQSSRRRLHVARHSLHNLSTISPADGMSRIASTPWPAYSASSVTAPRDEGPVLRSDFRDQHCPHLHRSWRATSEYGIAAKRRLFALEITDERSDMATSTRVTHYPTARGRSHIEIYGQDLRLSALGFDIGSLDNGPPLLHVRLL
jgi:hypothetical protein